MKHAKWGLMKFNLIILDIQIPPINIWFLKKNNYLNRTNNINSFLAEAKDRLHKEGCLVSADIFGFILTNTEDGGMVRILKQ